MKNCSECNREFAPSSRHKKCPACRHQDRKNFCACGNKKQGVSKTCADCFVPGKMENNPNWRGGRVRQKAGYVMLRVPNHPRASRNSGYVFEHILVMEESLGRTLFDEENVHHINGVKDDNRIENLELWTKPQPTGIRAKDAVTWAREILARYPHL